MIIALIRCCRGLMMMESYSNKFISWMEIPVLRDILPDRYDYTVTSYTPSHKADSVAHFSAVIRVSIQTHDDLLRWKKEFQERSCMTLRVNKTYPDSGRYNAFREDYHCQHGAKRKGVGKNIGKGKKTGCQATLNLILKRIVKYPRSSDILLKTHPTVVRLNWRHNHPLALNLYHNQFLQSYGPPSVQKAMAENSASLRTTTDGVKAYLHFRNSPSWLPTLQLNGSKTPSSTRLEPSEVKIEIDVAEDALLSLNRDECDENTDQTVEKPRIPVSLKSDTGVMDRSCPSETVVKFEESD